MDGRFGKGQTGGDQQIPLQTSLWLEANFRLFRAGVEFWDARQSGSDSGSTINTTMVDVADFPQIYGAWSTNNLLASGLGFELKGGRQTLDLGSRRLIARNAPDAPDPENVNYFYVQSMLRFYPQSTKGSENGYISKSGFMHRIFPSGP
jgi:hypothetical protein